MRLGIAVTEFPVTSQTFVVDHITGLLARGHTVDIHAQRKSIDPLESLAAERVLSQATLLVPPTPPDTVLARRVEGLRFLLPAALRHPIGAPRLLRNPGEGGLLHALYQAQPLWRRGRGYQLLHAHFGQNGMRLLPLMNAMSLDCPLVVTFHGYDVHGYLRNQHTGYYRRLFERADALVVCSEYMRNRLLVLGAHPEKLFVLPNPVNADQFPYRPRTAMAEGDTIELLSIGRLSPVKGAATLLRALASPELKSLPLRLHLVGDGPMGEALRRQVYESNLAERVVFHGAVPHEAILPLLDRCTLYLAPGIVDDDGHAEAQGIALLEAMASGLPVIASAVGGMPETLGATAAALLPAGDSDALASAIKLHLAQPSRWADYSRAGRERVLNHYQTAVWLDRLEALYLSLLQEGAIISR